MLNNMEDLEQWHEVTKEAKETARKQLADLVNSGLFYPARVNEFSAKLAEASNLEWHVAGIVNSSRAEVERNVSFDDILLSQLVYFSTMMGNTDTDDKTVVGPIRDILKTLSLNVENITNRHGAKMVRS